MAHKNGLKWFCWGAAMCWPLPAPPVSRSNALVKVDVEYQEIPGAIPNSIMPCMLNICFCVPSLIGVSTFFCCPGAACTKKSVTPYASAKWVFAVRS